MKNKADKIQCYMEWLTWMDSRRPCNPRGGVKKVWISDLDRQNRTEVKPGGAHTIQFRI